MNLDYVNLYTSSFMFGLSYDLQGRLLFRIERNMTGSEFYKIPQQFEFIHNSMDKLSCIFLKVAVRLPGFTGNGYLTGSKWSKYDQTEVGRTANFSIPKIHIWFRSDSRSIILNYSLMVELESNQGRTRVESGWN